MTAPTPRLPLSRRHLLLAAAGSALLSACASSTPPHAVHKTDVYKETVTSVLMSQDGKYLVIIGEKHHYIFDAPPKLVAALESPLHAQMEGALSRFIVAADGGTGGDYQILLPGTLSDSDATAARALGFEPLDGHPGLQLAGHLQGRRYLQGTVKANRSRTTLNHPYEVEVMADQAAGDRAADALVSPLSVATGGVTLLYYVALAPVLIPFALISRERSK